MITDAITQEFKRKVCEEIRLLEEGKDRFRVFTPFRFDDGDHLAIVLKKEKENWLLSDEGHTYLHLSYRINPIDLATGTRRELIEYALQEFQVEDRYGELIIRINENEYGNALFSFAQALLKISDINYLSRERVKYTFYEDFRSLIEKNVPKNRYTFEWHDPQHDPDGVYEVDCYINHLKTPLYIYALPNDNKVKDATISLFQFEKWQNNFYPVAIFQDESAISKKVLKKFSKVCEKQFPNFKNNQEEIIVYLKQVLSIAE
ncbi:DUF1828 domain-containing protein [Tolypothrix sp. FACHB-123]|uniref:DUF1828 domain-containing protein n=1 Tax=Tolypothrix sp. FACHB-123 TaxID=2692868 RepID=UPI001684CF18|nr:DUF1828 domain-containing protein [Tolypothrix sp. FACHB-123]MBD2353767.1 DUF1828 domain-containing protein [Tolypothrix sp. FACHB-123]